MDSRVPCPLGAPGRLQQPPPRPATAHSLSANFCSWFFPGNQAGQLARRLLGGLPLPGRGLRPPTCPGHGRRLLGSYRALISCVAGKRRPRQRQAESDALSKADEHGSGRPRARRRAYDHLAGPRRRPLVSTRPSRRRASRSTAESRACCRVRARPRRARAELNVVTKRFVTREAAKADIYSA